MRPSQMRRLRTEDFRLDEPIPYTFRCRAGRAAGSPSSRSGPEGVAAARAFLDAEAFRLWPRSSVNVRSPSPSAGRGGAVFTTGLRGAGTDGPDIQDL